MIPFFNISNIFDVSQDIRQNYELHRAHAASNNDYRNTVLVQPLEQSLTNLQSIHSLILSRIKKEEVSGADMTAVNTLLVTAEGSLLQAESAVAQATSTPHGTSLHPAYVNAHFALNEARDAFLTVVDAIALAEASSTATTSPVASPTPPLQ